MNGLVQKIKSFLLDIMPDIEANKNEIPTVMSVEDKIQTIGALEMVDEVIEQVETMAELNDALAEAQLTPAEIGLSAVETVEESNEVKLQKQVDSLLVELEATRLELSSTRDLAEKTKLELSKTEKEYKQSFSLSAIKGTTDNANLSQTEILRKLMYQNNTTTKQ